MRSFLKFVAAAIVATLFGILSNVSAAELNPVYAPYIVRWGWLVAVCGFGVYVLFLFGGREKITGSWLRAGNRPVWLLMATCLIVGYPSAVYCGVNAFWDKFGIPHKRDSLASPGKVMPAPVPSGLPPETKSTRRIQPPVPVQLKDEGAIQGN